MAIRSILFGATVLAAAGLFSGCSKTDGHKESAAPPADTSPATPPQAAAEPLQSGTLIDNGEAVPIGAAARARAQAEREAQLEMKASAAEARARLAEIELQERTAQILEQQQQAARAEAERAAALAVENANLRADAENATLRANMIERERAVEAERAAYGMGGNVIVVQPPQRHGYDRAPWNNFPGGGRPPNGGPHDGSPHNGSHPNGGRVENVGLNRPAVPDLTPPGPPATFSPPTNVRPAPGEPQVDTMRARRGPVRQADTPAGASFAETPASSKP